MSIELPMNLSAQQTMDLGLQHVSAYGEQIVGQLTTEGSLQAVYGLMSSSRSEQINGGTVTLNGSEFVVDSGTNVFGVGFVGSHRSLTYHPGIGGLARLSARFEATGVANTSTMAGLLNGDEAIAFGYADTVFGIHHNHGGTRALHTLTISAAASGSETATVFLDGTEHSIPVTIGTTAHNAFEIADFLNTAEPLWNVTHIGSDITAIAVLSFPAVGTFSIASTGTTAGSWATTVTGVAATKTHIAQADWNVNSFPGLDITKGNIYQIQFSYLGYGSIKFFIEDPIDGEYKLAHVVNRTNTATVPSFSNPTFTVSWTARSDGSASAVQVFGTSAAHYVEGDSFISTQSQATHLIKASVGTSPVNIFTVRCREYINNVGNLGRLLPIKINAWTDSNKGALISVLVNPTVDGEPSWNFVDETNSIAEVDQTATTLTTGDGTLIESFLVGALQSLEVDLSTLDEELINGEYITIAAQVISGASSSVAATLAWREDI